MWRLEAEDLVLELADRARLLVSEALGSLLERRDHRRRSAHEDLDVRGRSGELGLDHVGGDKAHTAVPLLGRVVQHVVYPKLGVLGCYRIDVLLQQDVLGVDVREDEVDLGLVACSAATQDGLDDLQHGRDTGSTCDHAEVSDEVGRVDHGTLGAADLDSLADGQRGDVLGDVARGVRLDEKVDVAVVFVRGDGGVGADDLLAIYGGGEGDVLADGETENVCWAGQRKAVAGEH